MVIDDVIARLAERIARDPQGVGPTGFPFAAASKASPTSIAEAEKSLGFSLPPLLRRAYLEVANGGFGPGYGIIGVGGGFTDDLGNSIVDLYRGFRLGDPDDPAWCWPLGGLPFCYWGCAVYSVVDAFTHGNPVSLIDMEADEQGTTTAGITLPRSPFLEVWLTDWLDGRG